MNTGNNNIGDFNSGDNNIGDMNSGDNNIGDFNSGYSNNGNWNTGDMNSGDKNSGYGNNGNRNIGYKNNGNLNIGEFNSGNWNSGNNNTGNNNIGNFNSGNNNIGNFNNGNNNTGNWNNGSFNIGYFNTIIPEFRMFNKETDVQIKDIIFPEFCYFKLTKWIKKEDMTEEEKQNNPSYKTTGGYLKTYDYKEAFRNSYYSLSSEEKQKQTKQLKLLPNFDKDIFKEISGIDIDEDIEENIDKKEEIVEMTLEEVCKRLGKNIKIVK